MRRMLVELYYGNINPNGKQFIRSPQFAKAMNALSGNEEELTGLLEGQEKKLFLEFANAQSEVNGVTSVESFINGFRLGARIALEIMSEEDSCRYRLRQPFFDRQRDNHRPIFPVRATLLEYKKIVAFQHRLW